MEQKEKFDACMQLAEFWSGRHDQRRQFEWKVALGLWAVIIGAIGYHEKLGWRCVGFIPVWPALSVIVFLAYIFLWLRPLWDRNRRDRDQAFAAESAARSVLANPCYAPVFKENDDVDVSWLRFLKDWSTFFQALATGILLIVSCVVVAT